MSYKIKSLLYFSCFVIASMIYYVAEQHDNFQEQFNAKTFVEVEYQDAQNMEAQKKELEEAQR